MLVSRLVLAPLLVVTMLTSGSRVAEANCGLDYCPLPDDAAAKLSLGTVQLLVRHVEFSLPEGEGSYLALDTGQDGGSQHSVCADAVVTDHCIAHCCSFRVFL